jgi:hypothetical protein
VDVTFQMMFIVPVRYFFLAVIKSVAMFLLRFRSPLSPSGY